MKNTSSTSFFPKMATELTTDQQTNEGPTIQFFQRNFFKFLTEKNKVRVLTKTPEIGYKNDCVSFRPSVSVEVDEVQ